jgi:3'-5' exoribonuclease
VREWWTASTPQLKALLRSMLDVPEVAEGLRTGHGPRGTPWAHRGGLAEHLASFARLAGRIAEHFPAVDRDLVVAGAIVQQLGRAHGASDRAFESTDRGRLVGAPATAAQLIHERARALDGFPPLLEQHLTHLALAGTVVPPATLEALVLRSARELEERVGTWLELMARDGGGGHWTDPARHEDGALWKGPAPTARGRAPVEPREPREPRRKKEARAPKAAASPPSKLAFKPLDELAPQEQPPEPPTPEVPAAPEAPAEKPPESATPEG